MLLRQCGLQCLEVKLETPKEEHHASNTQNKYSPNRKSRPNATAHKGRRRPSPSVKPALPANLDHRSPRERYLDESRRAASSAGSSSSRKDGKFNFVDDGEAIARKRGLRRAGRPDAGRRGSSSTATASRRPELAGCCTKASFCRRATSSATRIRAQWPIGLSGKPEDPWKHEQMIVLRRPATLELLTFSTMSKTGRRAVGNLLKHYDRLQRAHARRLPRRAAQAERLRGQPIWLGAYAAVRRRRHRRRPLGRRCRTRRSKSEMNDEIPI